MRSGLTLVGAQGGFQFPPQAFGFLLQALDLFEQPLILLLRPLQLPLRNKLDTFPWRFGGGPDNRFHPTLR